MKRLLAGVWLAVTLVAGSIPPASQEYVLKAKVLLAVLPYFHWPTQEAWGDRPFQIAVLGQSPFGPHLDQAVQNLTVHHRTIRVRYIRSQSEAEDCQAIFICPSEVPRLASILKWAQGKPILTMADNEEASASGVMMNFILEDRFVRLAVNTEATSASGIVTGSLLLRNARILSTRRTPL